jgi:ABC-type phosphate transport system substrate-binding protein
MKKTYILIWIFFFLAPFFAFPEVFIISNPDIQISTLNNKDVKEIFTGKRTRWNGNGKIIIATLYDSEVHRKFLEQFVKKTPSQFKNYWRSKVFTGEGMIPKTFQSEESLIEFVAATRGAVGYISAPTGKAVNIVRISDR